MGRAEQPAINFCDPFLARVPLPIVQKFYPLGFPLEIATNSSDVIAAATESWGSFACGFEREPIRVRAIVQSGGADSAPEPVYRLQGGCS